MISKLLFWLKCSRVYTLPITFFSWLIAFSYGLKHNGNIYFGLLALIGVMVCHLATNLFDDYMDFKTLKVSPITRKDKCDYLLEQLVTTKDVLKTVCIYLFIASIIGLFFIYARGFQTLLFIAAGGIIILLYSFLSRLRLSEAAIGLAYGPLMFGGIYFVMTGNLTLNSILVSVPSTIFTLNIIYADTLMDYNADKSEGKKTFVGLFNKANAKKIQILLLIFGYLSSVIVTPLVLITIPLAIQVLKSEGTFLSNMYRLRNLMVSVSTLLALAILL